MVAARGVWVARVGILISLVFLVLFVKDMDVGATWDALVQTRLIWNLPVILAVLASVAVRMLRWRILLGERHRGIGLNRLHRATYIGLFGNLVLPSRAGEILRSVMLARAEPIGAAEVFATVVVERVFDLVAAVSMILLMFALAPFPAEARASQPAIFANLEGAGWLMGIGTALVIVVLMAMLRFPAPFMRALRWATSWLPDRIQERGLGAADSFITGLGGLGSPWAALRALVYTALLWFLMLSAQYFAVRSFGFDLGFSHCIVLLVAASIAVAVPQGPGYVGPFHWAISMTLVSIFSIDPSPARAFAIAFWFVTQAPIIVFGIVSLHQEGLTLRELGRLSRGRPRATAKPSLT